MTLDLSWKDSAIPLFVKCLKSLPNLHMLEIVWAGGSATNLLKDALKRVKLPQIKTLILPPAAHPLLRPCCDVEDVVCVFRYGSAPSGEFLRSLESNWDSKVKRLVIPLVLWANPSRKWFSTLLDHRARMMTHRLQPQDLLLHVQGSPKSPSSTLTHTARLEGGRGPFLTRLKVHTRQFQSWSMRAKRSQISIPSRSHIFLSLHLFRNVCVGVVCRTWRPGSLGRG